MTRPLVLLTSTFPYGNASEPFLETEIRFLVERFPKVYILPSFRPPEVRPLPEGAEVINMPWLVHPRKSARVLALATREAATSLAATLTSLDNVQRYGRHWKIFSDNLAVNILKARKLDEFIAARGLRDALFYDYWFENSTLALALLRCERKIRAAVARAHNFDLYDDNWQTGEVPFRRAKSIGLDAIFAVSDSGAAYLKRRLPEARSKISVERLGVWDPGILSPCSAETPLIVTCALLRPEKRIDLVPEVLKRLKTPVRWLHFGDGPEYDRVLAAASRLPPHIRWRLAGLVPNAELRSFYATHDVATLLSVSCSEGLPVSMMEAQSYGIPVVACDVGGVSELITRDTGVLLSPTSSMDEIAAGVVSALEPGRFDRASIHDFFKTHFDAHDNYNRFADALARVG